MAMHFGILAADMDWSALLGLLRERVGVFVERGPLSAGEVEAWFAGGDDEGFRLMGGEHGGRAYVLDTSFVLSGMDPDLVAGLAAASGRLVVGCGAETASGTYYLVAARGGEVLRHHYHCFEQTDVPYDSGAPLPTEAERPLEGRMGEGMVAALRHLGFDYEAWSAAGTHHAVLYSGERSPTAGDGADAPTPLGDAVAAHVALHERRPRPTDTHDDRHRDRSGGGHWVRRLWRRLVP